MMLGRDLPECDLPKPDAWSSAAVQPGCRRLACLWSHQAPTPPGHCICCSDDALAGPPGQVTECRLCAFIMVMAAGWAAATCYSLRSPGSPVPAPHSRHPALPPPRLPSPGQCIPCWATGGSSCTGNKGLRDASGHKTGLGSARSVHDGNVQCAAGRSCQELQSLTRQSPQAQRRPWPSPADTAQHCRHKDDDILLCYHPHMCIHCPRGTALTIRASQPTMEWGVCAA